MSGAYHARPAANEWCDRALLARIHRYTVKRLRQEIEPVSTQDFMRFLFRWQHVAPSEQRAGTGRARRDHRAAAGLRGAGGGVGIRDPARATRELRVHLARRSVPVGPRRVDAADAAAVTARAGQRGLIRTTPVDAAAAPQRACGQRAAPHPASEPSQMSSRAQAVVEFLQAHGASFYDEIVDGTRFVAHAGRRCAGRTRRARDASTSDSFAGLRALLTPSEKRKRIGDQQAPSAHGVARHRGRGALVADAARDRRRQRAATTSWRARIGADAEMVEHIAHALLRRYGVVVLAHPAARSGVAPAVARTARACCGGSRRAATFAAAGSSPA